MLTIGALAELRCAGCAGTLDRARGVRHQGERIMQGNLRCKRCGRLWSVRDGIARLADDAAVEGTDRLMRHIYDRFAPLHDPAVRYLLPALQLGGSESLLRSGYIRRLELDALPKERPAKVLEVGVGGGGNLPWVREAASDVPLDYWGVDLSEGMLRCCVRRAQKEHRDLAPKLLIADAHALPFADASFDRVFHVGAIGGYRSPGRALSEMARVARPGTPIVVVDEQMDAERRATLYHRLTFRAITFYDDAPAAPIAQLPPGAEDVLQEQVSRFYYSLRFRMPRA